MMTMSDLNLIQDYLNKRFPDAKCALHFSNPFECLCAVMLSAQTTDKSVNLVTPMLFSKYPDAATMANANLEDIENCIRRLGLYKNKAKNLLGLSKAIVERFDGVVPSKKEDLVSLPGVGIKTANVVGAECFNTPAIAVDTHVTRVAKRLGLCYQSDEPVDIERKLEKKFPKERWIPLHHQLIWFGREVCHAQKPACGECGLTSICPYFKKTSIKTGR